MFETKEKKNIFWLVTEYGIKLGFGLFLSILVARYLGAEKYGLFSYVVSFVTMFLPFYTMGLEDVAIKDLAQESVEKEKILGSAFSLQLLGGVVAIFLINLAAFVIGNENQLVQLSIFVLSVATLFKSFQVVDYYFLSQVNIKKISPFRNIVVFLVSSLKLLALYLGHDWYHFIYISCAEVVLYGIVYILVYSFVEKSLFSWTVSRESAKKLFKRSLPIFFVSFFVAAMGKIDQVMLSKLSGNEVLGNYAVSVKLVELWNFLPLIIISTLYPGIIKAQKEGSGEEKIYKLFGSVIYLGFAFALSVSAISSPLINLLYGESYKLAGSYLAYYAFLAVPIYFGLAQTKFLMAREAEKEVLLLSLLALVINIISNWLLIPRYDAGGAILASALGYFVSNILIMIFVKEVRASITYLFKSFVVFPGLFLNELKK